MRARCPTPPRHHRRCSPHAACSFARNDVAVFGPLDFAVDAGEALLVQGDNGAGKTTLLRVLAGLLRADARRDCDRRTSRDDLRYAPARSPTSAICRR